ncbi:MAG TPA: glycoside hydrolase [Ensifer sp.]|nr:glycoside hydrolase [Ensifer sp.]
MPITNLHQTKRGQAAIAAIVALSVGGYVVLPSGYKVHDDTALAVTYLTKDWEGRRLKSYLDRIAKPPRWTVCDGDTTDVGPDTVETEAGCDKRLAQKMEADYRPPLQKCVLNWDRQPLAWRGVMLDFAWNTGVRTACNSGGVKEVNAAQHEGRKPDFSKACENLTLYTNAGGVFIKGLALRHGMGDATRIGDGELCRNAK